LWRREADTASRLAECSGEGVVMFGVGALHWPAE
jgi:hypothetical protein